ncbi:DUF4270 family protein [Luteibaculum oceani]|uniref:DUF4270 domain-containing protein n=1 Tax=Luteibaculum oceani TaxID=1294296 RepID=A0A5C6UZV5_9FLAO|nr:DUF4270 family protein [Luteibaculum oceani]TXC78973.1 DUF4270 domain-containing protein [Luteibaculum oceani]
MISSVLVRKALGFSALFLVLVGCEKPKGNLSDDLLPEGDILSFKSTQGAPFQWETIKADSIVTDNLSALMLGVYNDPHTGTANYSNQFQVRLSSNASVITNRAEIEIDSVNLTMAISSVYGSEDFAHQMEVYQLAEDLNVDSTYYSNRIFNTEQTNLVVDTAGMLKFSPDEIVVNGDTLGAQFKLPLKKELGEYLLKNSTDDNFLNNKNFAEYFKGLQVKSVSIPGSGDGSVAVVNPSSIYSNLDIYYHYTSDPDSTYKYQLIVSGNSVRSTTILHDFTGSEAELELNNTGEATYGLIKTGGGLFAKFHIDKLDSLKALAPIGIAQAELFLPVKRDVMAEKFGPSKNLILVELNEDGTLRLLPDQLEGSSYFGGAYDEEKGGYTFHIARFIQQYSIRTDEFFGFGLIPASGGVSANRTLLLKAEEDGLRPELIVYFTRL